ncbi:MAG: N-acetyltransferase family protein [Hyphomicrobiaceae bacterium]
MTTLTLEPLSRSDWGRVRAIFAEGLAGGLAAFMTEPPTWTSWDTARLPFGRTVARQEGTIVGWASLTRAADT